jgi:ankyrin repeat protein
MVAAHSGSLRAVKLLLNMGANTHNRDSRGFSAVHCAISGAWHRAVLSQKNEIAGDDVGLAILEVLLSSIDFAGESGELWEGYSPLHLAAEHGLAAYVR